MLRLSDTHDVAHHFNAAADTYDNAATVQQSIADVLITRILEHKAHAHNLLDLGCGTGFNTEKLLQRISYHNCVALDIAEQSLKIAQLRISNPSISFLQQDLHLYKAIKLHDLIFSNMALHWCPKLDLAFTQIQKNLLVDGLLAFSIPLAGTFAWLASKNNFLSVEEISQHLSKRGFTLLTSVCQSFVMHYGSPIAALKTIKATGASCLFNHRKPFLSGLRNLSNTELNYEIGIFIARKSQ